jgi:adenylylsulfate kinase-like enzyme
MDADLEYCRKHVDDNLYERFDANEAKNIPGLDISYDVPQSPNLQLKPERNAENVEKVMAYLLEKKIFPLD